MDKINQLDAFGFYVTDFIIGVSGDMPACWTADLVGDGYYKAQYQGATISAITGEWTGGHWVETGVIPPVDYLTPAIAKRDRLMAYATVAIAPLQDAVDLDEETPEELALLKKWKQYRIALNRLDLSTAPDINWPVPPVSINMLDEVSE